MSARDNRLVPNDDPGSLAPKFREAVEKALAKCAAAGKPARIYETYRSQELQSAYYERGRTVRPPKDTVTNASSNLYSWHGYGLAVDIVNDKGEWPADAWYEAIAVFFREEGCRWGGEWKMRDLPHFQWGPCRPSPSDRARELLTSKGLRAVWEAVGAIDPPQKPVSA